MANKLVKAGLRIIHSSNYRQESSANGFLKMLVIRSFLSDRERDILNN
jgi:hypothetical protein